MVTHDIDAMVDAYATCALWAGHDWDDQVDGNPRPLDENYSADDLAPEAWDAIRADCANFYEANAGDLAAMDAGQAGHDFYLTRNGHGAGFWDRGLGELGDRLTKAAHVYGESELYIGDEGKVYVA